MIRSIGAFIRHSFDAWAELNRQHLIVSAICGPFMAKTQAVMRMKPGGADHWELRGDLRGNTWWVRK